MMKKIIIVTLMWMFVGWVAFAQVGRRWDFWDDPDNILDNVAWEVNEDTWIQETQLNRGSQ